MLVLAAGKRYQPKKRKISKERTKQVMDPETEREIDAFMRQADSLTPEQINMVMEKLQKEGIRQTAISGKSLQSSTSVGHSRLSAVPAQADEVCPRLRSGSGDPYTVGHSRAPVRHSREGGNPDNTNSHYSGSRPYNIKHGFPLLRE